MRIAPVLVALAFASPALAQPSQLPAAPAPSAPRTPSPFQTAITRGTDAYRRRDYDAAATAFREAAGIDARAALPQLYLGYTYASRGDTATALGSFREAARLATAARDDANQARALEAVANAYETQAHWDEARAAWQEYVRFADAHAAVAYPAVGRARVNAIQRRDALAQEYEPVRQRIAARERENAAAQSAPAAPPALPPSAEPPSRRRGRPAE